MSSTGGVNNKGPVTTSQPVEQEPQEVVGKDGTGHQVKTKEGLPGGVKSGHVSEGRDIRDRTATLSEDDGFGSRSSSISSEGSEFSSIFSEGSVSTKEWVESLFSFSLDSEEYDMVLDDVFDSSDIPETTIESSPSSAESKISEKSTEKPKYVQEETLVTKTSASLAPGQLATTTGDTIAVDGGVAKANSGPILRSTEMTVDPNATKKANAKKLATEVQQEVAKRLKRSIDAGTADAEQIKDMLEALPKELHRPIRKAIFKKKVATAFSNFFHKLLAPKRAIAAAFSGVAKHFNGLVNRNMSSGMSEEKACEKAADTVTASFESPSALIASLEKQGFKAEAEILADALTLNTNTKLHQHMGRTLAEMTHIATHYKYPALSMLPESEQKFLVEASFVASGLASGRVRPNGDLRIKHKSGEDAFCTMEKVDHVMNILTAPTLREVVQQLRASPELSGLDFSKHLESYGVRLDDHSSDGEVSLEGVDMFDGGDGFTTAEAAPKVRTVEGMLEGTRSQLLARLEAAKGLNPEVKVEFMADALMVHAGVAKYNDTSFDDVTKGVTYYQDSDEETTQAQLKQSLQQLAPPGNLKLEDMMAKLLASPQLESHKGSLQEQWEEAQAQLKVEDRARKELQEPSSDWEPEWENWKADGDKKKD